MELTLEVVDDVCAVDGVVGVGHCWLVCWLVWDVKEWGLLGRLVVEGFLKRWE